MRKIILVLLLILPATLLHAQKKGKSDNLLSTVIPVPSTLDKAEAAGWTKGSTWMGQHQDINRIGQNRSVDLVFLGNSITQSWGGEGRNVWGLGQSVWDKYYAHRNAANFGISGDRTQHMLWRIEHGNFDHIQPKVIVIMAGTNNIADNSEQDIAQGIKQILKQLRMKVPSAKLLLLGIFPRDEKPDGPLRVKVNAVNKRIVRYADNKKIFFLNLNSVFLNNDGTMNTTLMRTDFVHLQLAGYEAWAKAMEPQLAELINGEEE